MTSPLYAAMETCSALHMVYRDMLATIPYVDEEGCVRLKFRSDVYRPGRVLGEWRRRSVGGVRIIVRTEDPGRVCVSGDNDPGISAVYKTDHDLRKSLWRYFGTLRISSRVYFV